MEWLLILLVCGVLSSGIDRSDVTLQANTVEIASQSISTERADTMVTVRPAHTRFRCSPDSVPVYRELTVKREEWDPGQRSMEAHAQGSKP